jgi:hypothetical protein
MNQETKVANELQKMLIENSVPVSVQEDINELSDKLANGEITLGELENKDQFVAEVIKKAKNRIL